MGNFCMIKILFISNLSKLLFAFLFNVEIISRLRLAGFISILW